MLSLRNLNIVTAACAVLGMLLVALYKFGPVNENGIPQFLLLILLFAEFITLAGLGGTVMAARQTMHNGFSPPVLFAGIACLLFALAFGAFGIHIWQSQITL